jgi:hypothetical protein
MEKRMKLMMKLKMKKRMKLKRMKKTMHLPQTPTTPIKQNGRSRAHGKD